VRVTNMNGESKLLAGAVFAEFKERLDSWKEIAVYMNRDVRTIQFWEKGEGLPIHRHMHKARGTVYAYKLELDAWRETRRLQRERRRKIENSSLGAQLDVSLCKRPSHGMRLVVVPFENLSAHVGKDLRLGLTDDTLTELGRLNLASRGISIISEVPRVGTERSNDEVVQCQDVDYILRGSVRRTRNWVRITAHLTQASDGAHVWSNSYDRELIDTLRLQTEVAKDVARGSFLALISWCEPQLAHTRTDELAYEEYLKGRHYWGRRTEEGLRMSVTYFNRSLRESPHYAKAYSGLADTFSSMNFYSVLSPAEAMPRAKAAAMKALETDAGLGEAHISLADLRMQFDWDWDGAEKEYKLGIELNPGYATAHHWYAHYLSVVGKPDEARVEIERAKELDPLSPIVQIWDGVLFYYNRQYDRAIDQYKKGLQLDPNFSWAHAYLGLAYEQNGLIHEAIEEFEKAISLSRRNTCILAMLGHAHAKAGNRDAALETLDILKKLSRKSYVPSYDVAALYAGLHKTTEALDWLNKACTEHDSRVVDARLEPRFDILRRDQNFDRFLGRLGLA
jgi:TolB-like protein/Tfp pilus assembly protein PilF